MGKIKNKITSLAKIFFASSQKKESLEEALFSIVKILKKEEKRSLKISYPNLQTPLDLQIARIKNQKL